MNLSLQRGECLQHHGIQPLRRHLPTRDFLFPWPRTLKAKGVRGEAVLGEGCAPSQSRWAIIESAQGTSKICWCIASGLETARGRRRPWLPKGLEGDPEAWPFICAPGSMTTGPQIQPTIALRDWTSPLGNRTGATATHCDWWDESLNKN